MNEIFILSNDGEHKNREKSGFSESKLPIPNMREFLLLIGRDWFVDITKLLITLSLHTHSFDGNGIHGTV